VLGALAILVVGLLVARLLAAAVRKGLERAGLDERLARSVDRDAARPALAVSRAVARGIYILLVLFVLVACFQTLGLTLITEPLNNVLNRIFAYAPQLFAGLALAALAFGVAWLVRAVLRRVLAASRVDQESITGRAPISRTVSESAFYLVLLLFTPAVLDAMGLDGLLAPITGLLDGILAALPGLFGAALLLIAATLIGRIVANLAENLLASIGFNGLPARLGLVAANAPLTHSPASVAARVIQLAILLFAAMEAAQVAGLVMVADTLNRFIAFAGQVILGVAIIALGLALANLAAGAVRGTGRADAVTLSRVTRGAILALAAAMALREMGLAYEIINLAFGLTLGAVAVAVALAFGLGGRDAAARQLNQWRRTETTTGTKSFREEA
jgi:hypothetical protein